MFVKKRIAAMAIAGALSFSMLLTSCAPAGAGTTSSGTDSVTPSSEGASSTEPSANAAQYPGTSDPNSVTINMGTEPPELNSILTTDATAMGVLRDTMQGLTVLDKEDKPVPGAAESWTISDDSLVYTFKIRKESKWTNGDPVTANDFYFAISTHFNPKTAAQYASTWAPYIKGAVDYMNGKAKLEDVGIKVIDDYTIEFTLANPCTYFLSICAFASFMPVNQKFYEATGADKYGKEADAILTNGPLKIESWTHEDSMVLTPSKEFWDAANYTTIEKINMKMITESGAALNSFQAGEMDMIGLSGEQVELMKKEGITPPQYQDGTPCYVEYNTIRDTPEGKAMAQKEVRQALNLALDLDSYIKNIAKNSNVVANTFTPNVVNGAEGKYGDILGVVVQRPTGGDYTAVKALFEEGLKKAGVNAADLKFSITSDEGDNAQKMCAFFQQQWKENLGIDVTITQLPFKARLAAQTSGEFDMCVALWGPDYNDAMTYLDLFVTAGGNNHTGWGNAKYDELLAKALKEADAKVREGYLLEAEKLLLDEMPVGPIYHRVRDYICSAKLGGVVRTAFQDVSMRWATINK